MGGEQHMDWPRARAVLLVALTLVNLLLAYSIWGPSGVFPELSGTPHQQQVEQVRAILLDRGFGLTAQVPRTPAPMPFLRVEYRPTLEAVQRHYELPLRGVTASPATSGPLAFSGSANELKPSMDPKSQVVTYRPAGQGRAGREFSAHNLVDLEKEVQRYLRGEGLLPQGAQLSAVYVREGTGVTVVEYVPVYEGVRVFSGYVRAEISARGVETVTQFWVQPLGFKDTGTKPVRPASEALLRLIGHLERTGSPRTDITEIQLGYYAGRTLSTQESGFINSWDTVPVWRIRLGTGDIYYINAFNGELEP